MRGKSFTFALTGLVLVAIGLGAALVARRLSPQVAPAPLDVALGEARLRPPGPYVRAPLDRAGGQLERLDLAVAFPGFGPAGPLDGKTPETGVIFITLTPSDRAIEPAARPVTLYGRFLEEDALSDATGLILRRFRAGSPYELEDLYIAPPEGRAFSARCTRPRQPADGLGETCLTMLRIGALDAQLRYSPALLPHWESIAARSRTLVEGMMR